jgi:hypothetical protein
VAQTLNNLSRRLGAVLVVLSALIIGCGGSHSSGDAGRPAQSPKPISDPTAVSSPLTGPIAAEIETILQFSEATDLKTFLHEQGWLSEADESTDQLVRASTALYDSIQLHSALPRDFALQLLQLAEKQT